MSAWCRDRPCGRRRLTGRLGADAHPIVVGDRDDVADFHLIEPGGRGWNVECHDIALLAANSHGSRGDIDRFDGPPDSDLLDGRLACLRRLILSTGRAGHKSRQNGKRASKRERVSYHFHSLTSSFRLAGWATDPALRNAHPVRRATMCRTCPDREQAMCPASRHGRTPLSLIARGN